MPVQFSRHSRFNEWQFALHSLISGDPVEAHEPMHTPAVIIRPPRMITPDRAVVSFI
jgi:hypothetical protein